MGKEYRPTPGDARWVRWREETLENFDAGRTAAFLVYRGDEPVDEGTLIGVEAQEARNLAIYLHWGYTEFVMSETEDGALLLYYRKKLN